MTIKRFLCAFLTILLVLAAAPTAALAKGAAAELEEARKLGLLREVWLDLEAVEEEAKAAGADMNAVTLAVYNAALNDERIDEGSFNSVTKNSFFFKVEGMYCSYDYIAHDAISKKAEMPKEDIALSVPGTKNGPSNMNVLLVEPYGYSGGGFTDQYVLEAQSIAAVTGGDMIHLVSAGATGPAIAEACADAGIVIFDSHGTAGNGTSYLCLTTAVGITSEDVANGWATSAGSGSTDIDGRYIANHCGGSLPNNIFWLAICQGMKLSGQGTTGYALIDAGAGCVYGYSQSVTFAGDYAIEPLFWDQMKNGATVAEAFDYMVANGCSPDGSEPRGDAFPIVMSPVDPFPANPDSAQSVFCDWSIFGGNMDPVAIESWSLSDESLEILIGSTARVRFNRIPDNANQYELEWHSQNENVAVVNGNNRVVTITAVGLGTTEVYCNVHDLEGELLGTASCSVTVTYDEALSEAACVDGGSLVFSSPTMAYPWASASVDGRNAAKSGNTGVANSTSTMALAQNMQAGETLSFEWKVYSEANYDKLGFYVNGTLYGDLISGNTDWEEVTFTAPSADAYTFEWRYTKDSSLDNGDDCGYVDDVTYSGDHGAEPVEIQSWSLSPDAVEMIRTGSVAVNFNRIPDNANNYDLVWGTENADIATVLGNNRRVTITGVGDGSTRIYCDVMVGNEILGRAYCSVNVLHFPDLNEALNAENGGLQFTSATADHPWSVAVIGDRAAAKSGNAGVSSSVSTLRLVLDMQAGETLSFDWMVSSEGNYDKLGFYVNNNQQGDLISGSTNWETITYTAQNAGTYTFEWRYTKDSSVNSGDDCGYVDNVRYSGMALYEPGDLDFDGEITISDALDVLRIALGLVDPTNEQSAAADVNGDGNIDIEDALAVLRIALGLMR